MNNQQKTTGGVKVYLAGKVTGLDMELVRAKFRHFQETLEAFGYHVVNPMLLPHKDPDDWHECMRLCKEELVKCENVFAIYDAHKSRGACEEIDLAIDKNIPVHTNIISLLRKSLVWQKRMAAQPVNN